MQIPYRDWALHMWKKNLYRYISLVLSIIMALCVLSGCGAVMPKTESGEAVVFTDALGRRVSVPKMPNRVAALIGSFADVWQLAGGTVCATAEDAWTELGLTLPDCVNIGGAHSPDFERLLSANPDFVLASAATASNVDMLKALENAGISVAYFDVNSFAAYLDMLDICTSITGRKDLYDKNGLQIKAQIENIKKEFDGADMPQEKKKVLLLRVSSGAVKAKGSTGTILGEMLRDFGCINIADSDKVLPETLSVESVIRQNPYHIFVVTMGDDTEKAMENLTRMMQENPAWGTLRAVQENRLHVMDRKLFNIKPNAAWASAYEKLSEVLLETTK